MVSEIDIYLIIREFYSSLHWLSWTKINKLFFIHFNFTLPPMESNSLLIRELDSIKFTISLALKYSHLAQFLQDLSYKPLYGPKHQHDSWHQELMFPLFLPMTQEYPLPV